MNFIPKSGLCGWRCRDMELSHLSGDHDFVNIYAKKPQCDITATPSQQRDPSPEHEGTVLRVITGSRWDPSSPHSPTSPTQAKALHKN